MTLEKVAVGGVFTICVWKNGVIKPLLDSGMSLAQARQIAIERGALIKKTKKHNSIVMSGRSAIASLLARQTPPLVIEPWMKYFAIGTGATPTTDFDTALETEVSRQPILSLGASQTLLSASTFFVGEELPFYIREVGVFGGEATPTPGSGVLFSRSLKSYDNTGYHCDLTFDYDLSVLGNMESSPPGGA